MNRYLAFFGDNYYPAGGMEDFLSDHNELTEAINAIATEFSESECTDSWGNVYDTVNKEIVYKK